jgi:hypothetical protein
VSRRHCDEEATAAFDGLDDRAIQELDVARNLEARIHRQGEARR